MSWIRPALILMALAQLACPKPEPDGPITPVSLTLTSLGASAAGADGSFAIEIGRSGKAVRLGPTPRGASQTFHGDLPAGDNDLRIELVAGTPPAVYRLAAGGAMFRDGSREVTGRMDVLGAVHGWTLRVGR